FSDAQATNDYFTPVGNNGDPVRLYVYNPTASTITVNVETQAGLGTAKTVAPGASNFFDVANFTGTRLFSSSNFLTLAAYDQQTAVHDWGFSLQPVSSLSQIAQVSLGVGNSANPPAGQGDTSPIWVTPLGATTVYVDYDGDPATGPLVDPKGNHYDISYNL